MALMQTRPARDTAVDLEGILSRAEALGIPAARVRTALGIRATTAGAVPAPRRRFLRLPSPAARGRRTG